MKVFSALFVVSLLVSANAQTNTVGTNSFFSLSPSANFSQFQPTKPENGSVQYLNPPIFTWLYYSNALNIGYPNGSLQSFRLQITTNGFITTNQDYTTSNNFYNCIGSITNADGSTWLGTVNWRVGYMDSTANPATLIWIFTNSFTMDSAAVKWDRAKYNDVTYLMSVGTNHPHLFFNTSNLASMAAFLHTNTIDGFSWNVVTQSAYSAITNTWWGNASAFTNPYVPNSHQSAIQDVCFAYAIDSNATLKAANPGNMVSLMSTYMIMSNWDQADQNAISEAGKSLPICYDWTFNDMTTAQASNVEWGMEQFCKFYIFSDWWFAGSPADTNRVYPGPYTLLHYSAAKIGSSHPFVDGGDGLLMTWASMGESATMRDFQQYFLNEHIACGDDPFTGRFGKGYNEQAFRTYHDFACQLMLCCHDSLFTNIQWYSVFPVQYCYNQPLNYTEVEDAFGSFGMPWNNGLPGSQTYHYKYHQLAMMYNNGAMYQQYLRTYSIRSGSPDFADVFDGFLPFYFTNTAPAQSDWANNYYLDSIHGWLVSAQYPPNNWQVFTNGCGFMTAARPTGSQLDHGQFCDGAIQFWAWGAEISRTGIGEYTQHPMLDDGLFVDGIGNCMPVGVNPTATNYAHFTSFTNTADFTFVSEDLSQAMNNVTNTAPNAGNGVATAFYDYATNARPNIVTNGGVVRNILFVHKETNASPYLVLLDEFHTTTNEVFQTKWNINDTNLLFTIDTNALKYSYIETNFFNGSNVTVYVQCINDAANTAMLPLNGYSNSLYNPFTGESYYGNTSLMPRDTLWDETVWTYNKTATTNFQFITVIVPVKWGVSAPTITPLDSKSFHIQYAGADDVVSWNETTNVVGATNYVVLTGVNSTNSGGGGSSSSGVIIQMNVGKLTIQ